jgi:Uma2 family endonuclease
MMATLTRPLSYEDWLDMPPAGEGREEVVNGELVAMPPNRYTHAEVIRRLTEALAPRLRAHDARVFGSSLSLLISREPLICRAPDIVVYAIGRITLDDHEIFSSAPDLIIEVLSPSENRRRKESKLSDYARIGVPEVWIVSPEALSIEVRLLRDSKLALEKIVLEGTIEPFRFPGVSIPVAEIWPPDLP